MPPKRVKTSQPSVKISQPDTREQSIDGVDIISDLPRNIMDCILGKMPIRDAVRTSVLSKKWTLYYTTISELVFDDEFCKELQNFDVAQKKVRVLSEVELEKKYQLDEIVTRFLMFHPGRIDKFEVCVPYFRSTSAPDVNKWIRKLSQKSVKKLVLEYTKETVTHKLPSYFFSCLDLAYLKLCNLHLSRPPPEFKGFLYLNELELDGVHFVNDCFESFLCSCPVLQKLVLHRCSGVHYFNISGSKLQRLFIKVANDFQSISLENAPNLIEVSIILDKVVIGLEGDEVLRKFLDHSSSVEILRLNGKFIQVLAETLVQPIVSTSPNSLKIIELKGVNFMNFDEISLVVVLIRNALNLHELHVEASTVKLNKEEVSGYLQLQQCKMVPLRKLHLVKLTNISSFLPEFEFIRFLLLSSPSLVTMSIVEHPQLKPVEALRITKQLLKLRLPSTGLIDEYRYTMSPTGKTQYCCRTSPPDFLSNLPDNVIDEILTCLPFKDVMRTSVLSKKWRYTWCRLPELMLDEPFWRSIMELGSFAMYFPEIIYHILTLRSGPITKFILSVNFYLFGYPFNIDDLIFFLSTNGIQHLLLRLPIGGDRYELPSSFFMCLKLKHLTLENCLILPPPAPFKGFDRLISLELRDVTISSNLLQSLISHSPLLERLVLQILDIATDVVEVNAPMLRIFDYRGRINCICLKNVPLLAKLSLTDAELCYSGAEGIRAIAKFFEPLSALEYLEIANLSVPPGTGEIEATVPFVLLSVKHLCVGGMYYDPLELVTSILCLIRSFPNLQYMDIQVSTFYDDFPAPEYLQVERFSNVTFSRLREVKSENFIGSEPEMQLMELLLAKSPMLVRMQIKLYRHVEESRRSKILAKLSEVKAASPKAEVDVIF